MAEMSRDTDIAGGDIIATSAGSDFIADGELVTVDGDDVVPHGTGIHASAIMIASNQEFYLDGIPVCIEGDLATCGHTTSGSGGMFLQ